MHVIFGIPIAIGTIYILTMTQFGRWLSLSCLTIIAIALLCLFAFGTLQWTEPGNDYRVDQTISTPQKEKIEAENLCDDIVKNGLSNKDPDVVMGARIIIHIECPERPEGLAD